MVTTQEITVDTETGEVEITNLRVHDSDLAAYLSDCDAAERSERAARAFEVGARTLQLAETSKDLEYVKREFERMEGDLADELEDVHDALDDRFGDDGDLQAALKEYLGDDGALRDHLDDAFGEEGVFAERLSDELGEDGKRIQQALDPDREGTPTARLKTQLKSEIEALKTQLAAEQGAAEERETSPKKGDDFEDVVGTILGNVTRQTSDTYEYKGETIGETPDAKTGDFVYELGGTPKRVVVEAKTEYYSVEDIRDEMKRAIENRDADYGVFVTDHIGNLPRTKIGWFHEFGREFAVVALGQNADEDPEPAFLRFALNWAQVRALHDADAAGEELDPDRVRAGAEAVEEKIGRFAQVRKQCTAIEDSVDDIRDELTEIEDEIENRLDDIREELDIAP